MAARPMSAHTRGRNLWCVVRVVLVAEIGASLAADTTVLAVPDAIEDPAIVLGDPAKILTQAAPVGDGSGRQLSGTKFYVDSRSRPRLARLPAPDQIGRSSLGDRVCQEF